MDHTEEAQSRTCTGVSPCLARAWLSVAFSCHQGSSRPLPSTALPRMPSGPPPGPAVRSAEGTQGWAHMAGLTRAGFCCLLSRSGCADHLQCCPGWWGAQGTGCRPSRRGPAGGQPASGQGSTSRLTHAPRLGPSVSGSPPAVFGPNRLCRCACAHSPWGVPTRPGPLMAPVSALCPIVGAAYAVFLGSQRYRSFSCKATGRGAAPQPFQGTVQRLVDSGLQGGALVGVCGAWLLPPQRRQS